MAEKEIVIPLSEREKDILSCIAHGWSNKRIADFLGISHQTVKNHVSVILGKLGAKDRNQAVLYALQNGFIRLT